MTQSEDRRANTDTDSVVDCKGSRGLSSLDLSELYHLGFIQKAHFLHF